jgi:FixJ family two-component response regulator
MDMNVNILVVDTSQTCRDTLTALLQGKGHLVRAVSSAEDALAMFGQERFNVVLTDIMMPGISGLILLKVIKEEYPDTEVVVISGNASSFTIMKALRLGAFDFIVKPLDEESILFSVVERAMEKQQLAQENQRLIEDLSDKNRQLQTTLAMMQSVNRACAVIASSLDISDILKHLVEIAVEQLSAQKGYLLLLDKAGREFSMKVSIGIDHSLAKRFRMPVELGISGKVASEGTPLRVDREIPPELTHLILEEDDSGELFSSPGILSAPLSINGKVVGVVNISGKTDGCSFGRAEAEFMTTLANHAAIALTNAGNYYRLKKASA